MLFDLQGKRRRVVQGTYLVLAILLGGGLVLFGVGSGNISGGLFDAITGKLQEQDYSIYRDMRSWTAALTFRVLNSVSGGQEFSVGFTFSFKAFPRFGLGHDAVNAASLIGY